MNFSPECQIYINEHLYKNQDELFRLVGKLLPSGLSSILWDKIPNKIEIPSVGRNRFRTELLTIADRISMTKSETIFILNIDDAFPALETNLNAWEKFSHELDYVNTMYLDSKVAKIIHWDFYKDLHATIIDPTSS